MTKAMGTLLKLEEVGMFLLSIILFNQLDYPWWVFPACLLLPDISMIGYVMNLRIGAWIYNFFHHKLAVIITFIMGIWLNESVITLAGVILLGHSAMDRMFGIGLKYKDRFTHTHLSRIDTEF
ncbi:DUF4260 domain-containing protein [Flavivirga sp. 57AJ16]|uniref:DUF4260 domain-containing protein n=1 Tax=Flavivirga sp. 57AJ16 TaxID=3025307 RepID=UPI002366C5B6|nr:DUF4260 domain-containing protein [Flavivirga sp. 57AJ16]MDD7886800.1 DUF4260 domain-containing protein [Flavivirga sp. 57AJ16]